MFQVGTKSLALVIAVAAIACSGMVGVPTPTPTSDASPARTLPNVRSGGGLTLETPRLVPIFFAGDPREAELVTFFGELAGSDYWKQTTAEYGVGDLRLGPAIHADGRLPTTMTDLDVTTWLISRFDGSLGFDEVDAPSSIYTIFFTPETVIDAPWGVSCVNFHAYHSEAVVHGKRIAFVAIPRCSNSEETELDALTRSVSHELIEAATDPFVDSRPAYAFADDRGLGWALGAGAEVADLCTSDSTAYGNLVGGHSVARTWSNLAASAGHDPCVPAAPGPYYNAEPIFPEMLSFKLASGGKTSAKSVKVPVGESRTIEVVPFSDGAIESWTLDAQDTHQLAGASPEIELRFDDATARPGEARHLTITRLTTSATDATVFVIFSHVGAVGHPWWGVVGN